MHSSYFKYDTIFAADLYGIYNGSPCKSHTDQPLILYLLLRNQPMNMNLHSSYCLVIVAFSLFLLFSLDGTVKQEGK